MVFLRSPSLVAKNKQLCSQPRGRTCSALHCIHDTNTKANACNSTHARPNESRTCVMIFFHHIISSNVPGDEFPVYSPFAVCLI